jgi:hypothetical protein
LTGEGKNHVEKEDVRERDQREPGGRGPGDRRVKRLGRLTKVECPQSYLYTIAASLIRDRRRQLGQHYA